MIFFKTTFWPVVPINSQNHIHLYPKFQLTYPEQKIRNMYSLVIWDHLFTGSMNTMRESDKIWAQKTSLPVSQRWVNDCSHSRFFLHASWILTGGTASSLFSVKSHSISAFQPGSIWTLHRGVWIRTSYIMLLESIIVTVCTTLRPRNRNIDRG